jgi:hypothetical protein
MIFILSLFCFFGSSVYSQTQIDKLLTEKEDAIMELTIKEKQREIEKEKAEILEEESKYQSNVKGQDSRRILYDFLFPGWGHFQRGNHLKAFLFGTLFWSGAYSSYTHFNHAVDYSKRIERESVYNPLIGTQLISSYRYHYRQSNIFLAGTAFVYVLNLFFSFQDEKNFYHHDFTFFHHSNPELPYLSSESIFNYSIRISF